jgi:hypothetical protein
MHPQEKPIIHPLWWGKWLHHTLFASLFAFKLNSREITFINPANPQFSVNLIRLILNVNPHQHQPVYQFPGLSTRDGYIKFDMQPLGAKPDYSPSTIGPFTPSHNCMACYCRCISMWMQAWLSLSRPKCKKYTHQIWHRCFLSTLPDYSPYTMGYMTPSLSLLISFVQTNFQGGS